MSKQYERLSKVIAKSLNLSAEELQSGFRLARADEVPAVSQMRVKVFAEDINVDDENYLSWRYFGRKGYDSTLWVFEFKGQIIGAMGTEPVLIDSKGQHIPAVRSMDAIIHPDYDNRGLGAWMVLALQETYDCILVSGGNENSTSMLKKLFTALPVRKNYKLLLKSNAFLADKIPAFLSSLISPFVNFVIDLFLVTKWSPINEIKGVTIKKFSTVEHFLNELTDNKVSVLADVQVVRDKAYLEWRYQQNPRANVKVCAAYKAESIIGFVIYSFSEANASSTFNRGRVIDWLMFDENNATAVLSLLLKDVCWELKKSSAEQVFMVLNDQVSASSAEAVGFSLRNIDSRFFVFHKDLENDHPLFVADNWFQTMSDSDGV